MMSFADRPIARLCRNCGQFHSPTDSHLYDYHQPIDDDLTCGICLQPLVDPVDTRCGHTFCARCIKNFLKLQNVCPNDRNPLSVSDLQQAPVIIRRLLDKLQVVCPNVDYCEEVLPRCELEDHLIYRCKGAVVRCHRHEQGCKFQGPRSAIESHMWECEYRDDKDYSITAPVIEGQVSRISIPRGSCDLGVSIIGGCDTPLTAVSIQEIFPNGLIDRDDRLRPGDQILEVNGVDLTRATHLQAKRAFNQILPLIKFTVFRNSNAEDKPIEREDILKITLVKELGRQLGIKLVGKRGQPGVYIKDLIPASVACMDGQLKVGDRILEVNSDDLSILTQENAANHIQAAHGKVQLVISRKSRSATPDLIKFHRINSHDSIDSSLVSGKLNSAESMSSVSSCKEKTIIVNKARGESLGLSVSGGLGSQRGDTPLYVMYTLPAGPAARSGVKRGDILLSVNGAKILGLSHDDAVRILKSKIGHRKVELKLLDTSETAEGNANFLPTWMYWLDLPSECWLSREVKLNVTGGDLGFLTTGGRDSVFGEQPIFVKAVKDASFASKLNVKVGDIITSINGQPTKDLDHSEVVYLLNTLCSTEEHEYITLKTVSWPGSIV